MYLIFFCKKNKLTEYDASMGSWEGRHNLLISKVSCSRVWSFSWVPPKPQTIRMCRWNICKVWNKNIRNAQPAAQLKKNCSLRPLIQFSLFWILVYIRQQQQQKVLINLSHCIIFCENRTFLLVDFGLSIGVLIYCLKSARGTAAIGIHFGNQFKPVYFFRTFLER